MRTKLTQTCLFMICLFVVACASEELLVSTDAEYFESSSESSSESLVESVVKEAAVAVEEVAVVKEVEVIVAFESDDTTVTDGYGGDHDDHDDEGGMTDTVEGVEVEMPVVPEPALADDSVVERYDAADVADESAEMADPEPEAVWHSASTESEAAGEVAMVRPRPEEPDVPSEPEIDPDIEPELEEPRMPPLQSGLLTAGDIDDNLNLDSFMTYINNFAQNNRGYPFLAMAERVEVTVVDSDGRPVKHAEVVFGQRVLRTAADGKVYFHPQLDMDETRDLTPRVTYNGKAVENVVNSGASFQFEVEGAADSPQQLDLAFIIDTTGSMGDELLYLQVEFESIIQRVQDRFPDADLRFGLTLYRDTGDRYVVRSYPFTQSVVEMQGQLNAQRANGGGDYEEAVERGLEDSLAQDWRPSATQIAFLVADAPPRLSKLDITWAQAIEARDRGIIINTLASSGVDEGTEYMMRSMAALTQGRHLFLTDDSGIGGAHKEPTIPCYVVTPLNDLMVRVISSQVLGERIEAVDENIRRTSGQYVNGVCQ